MFKGDTESTMQSPDVSVSVNHHDFSTTMTTAMNTTTFTLNPAQQGGYGANATSALLQLAGVTDVQINAPDEVCTVLHDARQISPTQLLAALDGAGYASEVLPPQAAQRQSCCGGCGGG